MRATIEDACTRSLSLRESVRVARITRRESGALVARSRGKPYVITDGGEPTISEGAPSWPTGARRGAMVAVKKG